MMEEIWKDIEGFEGLYQVSNIGMVKSLKRLQTQSNGRVRLRKERILIPYVTPNGYLYLKLAKDHRAYAISIHRLVAIAFIPNPNNLRQVNHKDCNKLNNDLSNLEWCTPSQNCKHAFANGRSPHVGLKGKLNHACRKTINIETGICYDSITEAYFSTKRKISKPYFQHMLNGRKKNYTPFKII